MEGNTSTVYMETKEAQGTKQNGMNSAQHLLYFIELHGWGAKRRAVVFSSRHQRSSLVRLAWRIDCIVSSLRHQAGLDSQP